MKIVDYVHSPDQHEGFVLASFCLQTGEPDAVLRELIKDGAVIKVAEAPNKTRLDGTPLLYGWAGRIGSDLIYCYVRHDLRAFPVIPTLLDQLDINGEEVPTRFLTRQIKAIGRHWQVNFVPTKGEN